jgi:EAL domain-containing protein (putative c-di-GMP-specific phosphodiesterase class I)/predicted small metal-binding protein
MLGTRTLPDCRPLLAGADDLTLVFQPIVDLTRATVAGYQALARFPGTAGPDVWFAAAADAGLGAELQALVIHKALDTLPDLPVDTFLTVRVSPHLVATAVVRDAFATPADLSSVVLEVTERTSLEDPESLRRETDALRARGARIVTLDRALADEFAGRIDPWLLAEDLETGADLTDALRLGVPLGRGWVLGGPTPGFAPLAPDVVTLLRSRAARVRRSESMAHLLRPISQYLEVDAVDQPAVPGDPLTPIRRIGRTTTDSPTPRSSAMKTFACGDVIPGCSARFAGLTEGDILAQVTGHAAAHHGVSDMTLELVHAVRAGIATV